MEGYSATLKFIGFSFLRFWGDFHFIDLLRLTVTDRQAAVKAFAEKDSKGPIAFFNGR